MSKMVKIAQVGDLSPGEGTVIEVESQSIALFNVNGTFHAMQNTCTHVGGPLGEGELKGGRSVMLFSSGDTDGSGRGSDYPPVFVPG